MGKKRIHVALGKLVKHYLQLTFTTVFEIIIIYCTCYHGACSSGGSYETLMI